MNQENKLSQLIADNAFFLMLIPIITYIIVFSYESGYCYYFKIPINFIQLDPIRIFYVMIYIAFFTFLFLAFALSFQVVTNNLFNSNKCFIKFVGYSFLLASLSSFLFIPLMLVNSAKIIAYGEIFFYNFFLILGFFSLIYITEYFNYIFFEKKIEICTMKEKDLPLVNYNRFFRHIKSQINSIKEFFIYFILLISLILFMIHSLSHDIALSKTNFFKLVNENKILIRQYGNKYFFKEYDDKNKILFKKIIIINSSEIKKLELVNTSLNLSYKEESDKWNIFKSIWMNYFKQNKMKYLKKTEIEE